MLFSDTTNQSPGLTIMKDVAIAKSEFVADERAITKVQNFQVCCTACQL